MEVDSRCVFAVALAWSTACAGGSSATATAGESATSTTTSSSSTAETNSTTATTTTSTTSTSTDPTSESSTGCSFLGCNDAATSIPGCDPWLQDCPEGEKCNAWANDDGGSWNANKCVPVDPDPDGLHEPCTVEGTGVSGVDSCDQGAMCWNVNPDTHAGICIALCEGDVETCNRDTTSCCPDGGRCYVGTRSVLILCLQFDCDPIAQDCWEDGLICYPHFDEFSCAGDLSGAMGQPGDPCEDVNDCDPGSYCGDPTAYPGCDPISPGCCVPFCELDAPKCVLGTECTPWFDNPWPPYENLGACLIP